MLPVAASAHVPDEATARITLRDDHLEVLAEWDLFRLLERAPTEVATMAEAELVTVHRDLVRKVEHDTVLTVDGTRRSLIVSGFPTPPEFRALAATLSASEHEHGARARIRLEAPDTVRDARSVSLACPAGVGPVHASFVQPAQRYVRSGESASFVVLAPPSPHGVDPRSSETLTNQAPAASSASRSPSGEGIRLALPLLVGASLGALAITLFRRGERFTRENTP